MLIRLSESLAAGRRVLLSPRRRSPLYCGLRTHLRHRAKSEMAHERILPDVDPHTSPSRTRLFGRQVERTVDPVGPHLVPRFIVRRTKFMERGTSFPVRSPCHLRLSPESGDKAELASDKMLKLVDGKFLITDNAFHEIAN